MPQVQIRTHNSNPGHFPINSEPIRAKLAKAEATFTVIGGHNPIKLRKRTYSPGHRRVIRALAELECSIEEADAQFDQLEVASDQDREALRDIAIEMFKLVKSLDQNIILVRRLPREVSWRREVYTKFEHLANNLEDIAETAALSLSKKFKNMVLSEINDLTNVSPDNWAD